MPSNQTTASAGRAQAIRADLGELVSVHEVIAQKLDLILGIATLTLGAGGGVAGVFAPQELADLVVVVSAVLAVLGLVLLIKWGKARGLLVNLHENGFIYCLRGKSRVVFWNDIDWVTQRIERVRAGAIPGPTHYKYSVRLKDKTKLVFKRNLGKVAALGSGLQDLMAKKMLPLYMSRIESGETVDFGAIAIDRQGLVKGRKRLSWSEIKELVIYNGELIVKKDGLLSTWAKPYVFQVRNVYLFLALTKRLIEMRTEREFKGSAPI